EAAELLLLAVEHVRLQCASVVDGHRRALGTGIVGGGAGLPLLGGVRHDAHPARVCADCRRACPPPVRRVSSPPSDADHRGSVWTVPVTYIARPDSATIRKTVASPGVVAVRGMMATSTSTVPM